jgi:hypothetical protein
VRRPTRPARRRPGAVSRRSRTAGLRGRTEVEEHSPVECWPKDISPQNIVTIWKMLTKNS